MLLKYEQFKYIVDVLFAILCLIILFPLFIIALLLMIKTGEFLFFQTRIDIKKKDSKL